MAQDPRDYLETLQRAMATGLGLNHISLMPGKMPPALKAKQQAYAELSGVASRIILERPSEFSEEFDTRAAAYSARLLAAIIYAFDKAGATGGGAFQSDFCTRVITGDRDYSDWVNHYFGESVRLRDAFSHAPSPEMAGLIQHFMAEEFTACDQSSASAGAGEIIFVQM